MNALAGIVTPVRALSAATLFALTDCGAASQSSLPQGTPLAGAPQSPPRSSPGEVFISHTIYGQVVTFALSGKHTGLYTLYANHPAGMAVDASGNLYVAGTYGAVYMFAPGARKPTRTLRDRKKSAEAVAVGADGTVYVANQYNLGGSGYGHGNVVAYKAGRDTPMKTYDDAKFDLVSAVAVDSMRNLYAGYEAGSRSYVAEFVAGGSKPKEIITIKGSAGRPRINAMALDASGNLAVAVTDGGDKANLFVYPPGKSQPSRSFSIGHGNIQFAFDSSGSDIYTAGERIAGIFDYAAGKRIGSINVAAESVGVAVAPALPLP